MAPLRPTAFSKPLIGWREDIVLPELGSALMIAKIDTGARTAALHAEAIAIKNKRVRFMLLVNGKSCEFNMALAGTKKVKSSNGISEIRPIIETAIRIGAFQFDIAITLTDRTDMGVPMLIGRESIKGHFLVNPARSFILSRRKKK